MAQDHAFSFGGSSAHSPFENLLGLSTPDAFDSSHGIFGTPYSDTQEWDGQQTFPDDCAIRSQQFILEQFTGEKFDESSLVQEAQNAGIYTPGTGTPPDYVGNLLELHGIGVHHQDNATVADLADELAQGHKVMVAVEAHKLWGQIPDGAVESADHSIVVSGIDTTDPNDTKVIVNDPGTGEFKTYPMDHFLASWGNDGKFPMVATNDPSPASAHGMAHFDYAAGHIPDVAGIPYDEFHQIHDQPDFVAQFITLLHDLVDKIDDDLFGGGHHSSPPPPIDHMPIDHMPTDHMPVDYPSTTHVSTDTHPADVPPYLNIHEDTIIEEPIMSIPSPYIVDTGEPVSHFSLPQTSHTWFPSEVVPQSIPLTPGETDSNGLNSPSTIIDPVQVSDPTAAIVLPDAPLPPDPVLQYEPNSTSQGDPSGGAYSPPTHTLWDDHPADVSGADPVPAPEAPSDSSEISSSPTWDVPVIETQSFTPDAPSHDWSQLGDFPQDCHTGADDTQDMYPGALPADADLHDHFTV